MVVGARHTGSVTSRDSQPSKPDVIHDHIRPRQHQMVPIAGMIIRVGARHVKHTDPTLRGQTVSGSSCGSELSPSGGSTEMISDSRPDANRKVLIKGVREHLLPTAQAWRLWRAGPAVPAPGTGNRHIDLFCYLWPGQALVTKLHDLLRRGSLSRRTAATHGHAGTLELLADRAPLNTKLGSNLAQGPTLGVQVGRTLNVHG